MPETTGAHVRAERVSKEYAGAPGRSVSALADVSFELAPGSFTALVGPSGCGKSTLLNLLGALDAPTSGRVAVDGRNLATLSEAERDRYRLRVAGTVFQLFNLLPTMTAAENVALPMLLAGAPDGEADARSAAALAEVGLQDRAGAFPYELSGGQMQRVAVARALANGPALLLADEPTGNLDTESSTEIMELFLRLRRERRLTIVVVTHEPHIADYTRRIVPFRDGRRVAGEPQ